MKVIIESDEEYPHFRLYDNIPEYINYGEQVEVPDELVKQYNDTAKVWYTLQNTLEEYWKKARQ